MGKIAAPNERFGATAAVTPLKVTYEHERKYPVERLVKAATSQSRWDVGRKSADSASGHDEIGLKTI